MRGWVWKGDEEVHTACEGTADGLRVLRMRDAQGGVEGRRCVLRRTGNESRGGKQEARDAAEIRSTAPTE
jgi:hypothetical protein